MKSATVRTNTELIDKYQRMFYNTTVDGVLEVSYYSKKDAKPNNFVILDIDNNKKIIALSFDYFNRKGVNICRIYRNLVVYIGLEIEPNIEDLINELIEN